jgi:hypothetical protein
MAGVAAVIETLRASLELAAAESNTDMLAAPATAVVSDAVALPETTGTVAVFDTPFHLPIEVTNTTLFAAGALTRTSNVSPIFIAVSIGLPTVTFVLGNGVVNIN